MFDRHNWPFFRIDTRFVLNSIEIVIADNLCEGSSSELVYRWCDLLSSVRVSCIIHFNVQLPIISTTWITNDPFGLIHSAWIIFHISDLEFKFHVRIYTQNKNAVVDGRRTTGDRRRQSDFIIHVVGERTAKRNKKHSYASHLSHDYRTYSYAKNRCRCVRTADGLWHGIEHNNDINSLSHIAYDLRRVSMQVRACVCAFARIAWVDAQNWTQVAHMFLLNLAFEQSKMNKLNSRTALTCLSSARHYEGKRTTVERTNGDTSASKCIYVCEGLHCD